MNARVAALGLAILLAGAPAIAEDEEEFEIDPTIFGYYVAISGGGALEQFSGVNGFDDGFGGGASFGYRAGEYASIEVQAEFLENFDTRRGAFSNEVDLWLTTINFRLHFPMGRFEPYLTYGGGAIGVDSTGAPAGRLSSP